MSCKMLTTGGGGATAVDLLALTCVPCHCLKGQWASVGAGEETISGQQQFLSILVLDELLSVVLVQ